MVFEEKTISTERIYEGKILNLRRDKVHVTGGNESYREIVEHRGGVAIAAITDDHRMVMVRQFRKAAEKALLEVPAGKIDPGENDHLLVAIRELKEETGYTAARMTHLAAFYTSVGYSTELLHLYLAEGLKPGETCFDDTEAIEIEEYDLDELKEMVADGKIEDAKTIAAIMMADQRLQIK